MKSKFLSAVTVSFWAFFMVFHTAFASDDFQYWSRFTLKTHTIDRWELSTYGDIRFYEDVSKDGMYLVSERLKYRWSDFLDLGVNYTYLNSRTPVGKTGQDTFRYQHRLEWEANPHWRLNERISVHNRNRMEFRWIEDRGSDNARFRQLWEVRMAVSEKLPIDYFFANNEVFYDFPQRDINEDRVIPLGVNLKLNVQTSLSVFYMIQLKRSANDWTSNQVLGTHLILKF